MRLNPPLLSGTLLRRYKRFLADIRTAEGEFVTIHCPNTGAMTGCDEPGSEVWYSRSDNPQRKYPFTLEVVVTAAGRVGVNTGRANALVREALESGMVAGFERCVIRSAETAIPDERGRFDFCLDLDGRAGYVEVKNLTLWQGDGLGAFPDAVSERAVKHVRALERRIDAGQAAALIFCVQHTGVQRVTTADAVHPEYGLAVRRARAAGVSVCAYASSIEPDEIKLTGPLPVEL